MKYWVFWLKRLLTQKHYVAKLQAERYIFSCVTYGERVYILRPCMIHGPGNKGIWIYYTS
jgi:nucleoside-diphosphate-sugar epimerase